MYFIRKYSNGWAVHDDDTGLAWLLSDLQKEVAKKRHPELLDAHTLTVFTDELPAELLAKEKADPV